MMHLSVFIDSLFMWDPESAMRLCVLNVVCHFLLMRRLLLQINGRCLSWRVVNSALAQQASPTSLLHLLPRSWFIIEAGYLIVKNIDLLTLLGHFRLLAVLSFRAAGRGPGILVVAVNNGSGLVEFSLKGIIVSFNEALFLVS
jgi:hypothetical protein